MKSRQVIDDLVTCLPKRNCTGALFKKTKNKKQKKSTQLMQNTGWELPLGFWSLLECHWTACPKVNAYNSSVKLPIWK